MQGDRETQRKRESWIGETEADREREAESGGERRRERCFRPDFVVMTVDQTSDGVISQATHDRQT